MKQQNGKALLACCVAIAWIGTTCAAAPQASPRNAGTLPEALVRAEQALANKTPDAAQLFEHASHIAGESATAEVGMVRAYMAGGQYRRALAFAHLVQGEHTRSSEGVAWAAFLNDRSGQTGIALQMLERARAMHMDDVALLCAQSEILIDRQQAARAIAELDAWLARNAPQAPVVALRHRAAIATHDLVSQDVWQKLLAVTRQRPLAQLATRNAETTGTWTAPWFDELADDAWRTGSGLIVDDGRHVIATLPGSHTAETRIRVRDAQGHVRTATVEAVLADEGLTLLTLDKPLARNKRTPLELAVRVFPGSPFHAIGFPVQGSVYAAFPADTPGFFARPQSGVDKAQGVTLGQPVAEGLIGAPVFSASGQLAGFVSSDSHTGAVLPGAALVGQLGIQPATGTTARLSNEEIYERALERVVLVVVSR